MRSARFYLFLFVLLLSVPGYGEGLTNGTMARFQDAEENDKNHPAYLNNLERRARGERTRNPELSIRYFKELYSESERLKDKALMATALYDIGRIYQDLNMPFPAIEYFLQAYKIAQDNDSLGSKFVLISIGNCYFHTGDLTSADSYYRQSLHLFRKVGNPFGISVSLNNLGLIKQKLTQYDSALYYFNQALIERKKTDHPELIGHSYYYIGTAYAALGDTVQATSYFSKAIPLLLIRVSDSYLTIDLITTLAECYYELGKIHDGLRDYPQALGYFDQALTIYDTLSHRVKVPHILIESGLTLRKMGQQEKAVRVFRKALLIADSVSGQTDLKESIEQLIRYFLDQGQRDSVWFYFTRYKEISDEIIRSMNSGRIKETSLAVNLREMETRALEKEKRFADYIILLSVIGTLLLIIIAITLLYIRKQHVHARIAQAEIQARKMAEEELEKTNRELKEISLQKDRFLSILSHDLRSPFNSLIGFSDLLVEEIAEKNMPELYEYACIVQQTANSTYQLLDNLLTWSRLQMNNMSVSVQTLNLAREIQEVYDILVVMAARKSIRIKSEVGEDANVSADRNMLHTVLRNLVANAVKFSMPDSEVTISAARKPPFYTIRITDTGIGIPAGFRDKLFSADPELRSTPGTQQEKGHGFGLLLCQSMVEMSGGRIWIESTSESGTTIAFTLPVA